MKNKKYILFIFIILCSFNTLIADESTNILGNAISNFLADKNNHFIDTGSIEITTSNIVGKVSTKKADSVYIENSDLIGFGVYLASYYYILFDSEDRALLKNAADLYFKDFENKKLDRKGKKTDKAYGSFESVIYFGSMRVQAKNYGYPKSYFGYTFKNNSPYFMISCLAAPNERRLESDTYPDKSEYTTFYFTKAQLQSLIDMLDNTEIR